VKRNRTLLGLAAVMGLGLFAACAPPASAAHGRSRNGSSYRNDRCDHDAYSSRYRRNSEWNTPGNPYDNVGYRRNGSEWNTPGNPYDNRRYQGDRYRDSYENRGNWRHRGNDIDGDGIPNSRDRDIDGDGHPNWRDNKPYGSGYNYGSQSRNRRR
jgi:hypothetical protein